MRIAVLPFNAAEGAKPQLGRQIAAFVGEQIRNASDADVQTVSLLTQVEQQGQLRTAFVNIGDAMLEVEQLSGLFEQSGADLSVDGLFKSVDDKHELTIRFLKPGGEPEVETIAFETPEIFTVLHSLVKKTAAAAGVALPAELAGDSMEFGTENAEVFLKFLEGFDALNYIQQSDGMVALEFNAEPPMDTLLEAVELDPEFEGPYQVLVGLNRACMAYNIGGFELCDRVLKKLTEVVPDDFAAFFALGELYQKVGDMNRAVAFFEAAAQKNPEDPAILNRLGNAQMANNMPVNAERNFRKAVEMEGEEKASMDFLAQVLVATGRAHEVPALWKSLVDEYPTNAAHLTKYAIALINNEKTEEGEKVFERGLETVEDNTFVKRFYAPYLVQKGDLDRAMDFYEDCIDVAPADVPLLLEYAQTLQAAERDFEIPAVLQNVLKANPDPNTRANTNAWLIELEQPKRVESVANAQQKLDAGDIDGALRELKPLRNWLADYWKMWALLSSAYNRAGMHAEAEESSRRLIEMFPGCEPAYGEYREALNGQGRNEEAYQVMQNVAMANPQSLSIHINLAIAAHRAGQSEQAKALAASIREAVKENQDWLNEVNNLFAEIDR